MLKDTPRYDIGLPDLYGISISCRFSCRSTFTCSSLSLYLTGFDDCLSPHLRESIWFYGGHCVSFQWRKANQNWTSVYVSFLLHLEMLFVDFLRCWICGVVFVATDKRDLMCVRFLWRLRRKLRQEFFGVNVKVCWMLFSKCLVSPWLNIDHGIRCFWGSE